MSKIALHPKDGQSVEDRVKELEMIAHSKLTDLINAYAQNYTFPIYNYEIELSIVY